jgi:hypothetical protein
MAWIGLLALAAAQMTVAVTCEEALEGFVRDDLMSRIFSHKQTGEGLDYLGGYPECFNTNGTYVTVFWMNNNVPTVSYGFCLPNYCELDEAQKIMESLSSRYDLSGQIKSTKISVNKSTYQKQSKNQKSPTFLS